MDLLTFLMQSTGLSDKIRAQYFASNWMPKLVKKGALIVSQGEHETKEHIILEGYAASSIYDPEGTAVCVGLYVGPCVITPNIARTRGGMSLVSVEAATDTLVMQMDSNALTDLMIISEPARDWANGVLQEELGRKVDREWALAALGGFDRLAWFRDMYPDYEEFFVHSLIASFLGITPVTLSRLRSIGKIR